MRRPNALQFRVLDELAAHPHGGTNDRDLALRLHVRSSYPTLRACERNGWARLYSAGFDGGLRWTLESEHSRSHEPVSGREWPGDFWMLTDAGRKALEDEGRRVWAQGEAERMVDAERADAARGGVKPDA